MRKKASSTITTPLFSERELKIIQLVCKEYNSFEIGTKLKLSPRTIEGIRLEIMKKMKTSTPIGLVIYAIKNGLVKI
jgi:DNA-binding NarL/FixJ family response regulator